MLNRRWSLAVVGLVAILPLPAGPTSRLQADTVTLKNGIGYRGTVDRDNTIIWVYDGLKRVVLRDSKIAKIESDASLRNLEVFRVEQPLIVHGGAMPREVVSVRTSPWNDRGRRTFEYGLAAVDSHGWSRPSTRAGPLPGSAIEDRRSRGKPGRDEPDPARSSWGFSRRSTERIKMSESAWPDS
ncbi:MAG: hypothetical protein U0794_07655 [Isosphaeraceae bacterium]